MQQTQPSIANNVPSDYWTHPYPAKMAETICSVDENCQKLGFDIWEAMHLLRQSYAEINEKFPLPTETENNADYTLLPDEGEDAYFSAHVLESQYQQDVQNLQFHTASCREAPSLRPC